MGTVVSPSRSRRILTELLAKAERRAGVESTELLAIGWPGRGQGTYRDDDGPSSRRHADDAIERLEELVG